MFFKMQNFLICGLFGFFRTEIKKFLSNFFAFSWPFLICFFDSAIEKSTKFVWFVKDKQFAGWKVLIKSDWSHLSICDESKDAHINWHHKCWIDWLCVICYTTLFPSSAIKQSIRIYTLFLLAPSNRAIYTHFSPLAPLISAIWYTPLSASAHSAVDMAGAAKSSKPHLFQLTL